MIPHHIRQGMSLDSSSEEDELFDDLLVQRFLLLCRKRLRNKVPCRTSILTGKIYMLELLSNNTRCFESMRMEIHVFRNLCDKLKLMDLLKDEKNVTVEEGVAMFLLVICHNTRQRLVAERFQHSTETVHQWFKKVLRALCKLGNEIIKPRNLVAVQPEILGNPNWQPYFENCIGAIDGMLVSAWAPSRKQSTYRCRKTTITQNVMVACSHDMLFTFVCSGWEGTTNDSRMDAICRIAPDFPMPTDDKYYVVDAGYPNMPGFLAPYRGHRYHRSDFRDRDRPRTKMELFNQRHSSVRNVIERCFGVLKGLHAINLGDSGFMVVHDGCTVFRSSVQQHGFINWKVGTVGICLIRDRKNILQLKKGNIAGRGQSHFPMKKFSLMARSFLELVTVQAGEFLRLNIDNALVISLGD